MRVVIVGLGGVGGYYAGLLARHGHEVRALARGAHLNAVRANGLTVKTSEDEWTSKIVASDQAADLLRDLHADDLILVTTKSYSLNDVAPAIRALAANGSAILPLQNGVEAPAHLSAAGIDANQLLGGVTYMSAARIAPGVIELRNPGRRLILGELSGKMSARAERIASAFREAGVDAKATEDINRELWKKFVFLSSLSGVCGMLRKPVGEVRNDPRGQQLIDLAVREAVTVARAKGIAFDEQEDERLIAQIAALPATTRPSLLLDLEAGMRTEVDVLSGAISRFGKEIGIATPVHDEISTVLRSIP